MRRLSQVAGEQLVSQMFNSRLARDRAAARTRRSWRARPAPSASAARSSCSSSKRAVPEGKITEGLGALMRRGASACSSSASATTSWIAPRRRCWPATSAPTRSATPPRARATPTSTCATSSSRNRFPASSSSTRSPRPTCRRSPPRKSPRCAKELITDDNRVVLGVAPEKKDTPPPSDRDAARGDRPRQHGAGRALGGSDGRARAGRETARARQGRVAPRGAGDRRDRADAVERRRGVAQADRLQERSGACSSAYAPGGVSLAVGADFKSASLATAHGRRRRHGRAEPRRPRARCWPARSRRRRRRSATTRRASAARARRRISRPRCS